MRDNDRGPSKQITVTVKFYMTSTNTDDYTTLDIEETDLDEDLWGYLLSFGAKIQVVSPSWLRKKLYEESLRMMMRYHERHSFN